MESVPPETRKLIMAASPKTASFDKAAAAGEPAAPAMAESQEQPVDDEQTETEAEGMAEGQALLPFEAPEAHAREWLNLFAPEVCTRVVDFCMGSGNMALAAARRHLRYQGYTFSDLRKSVCKQIMILKVVRELILQKKDGFFSSRFLSKSRSLGGSEAPSEAPSDATTLVLPGPGESPSKASEAATDKKKDDEKTDIDKEKNQKKSKTKKKKKSSSGSSSSSSGSF